MKNPQTIIAVVIIILIGWYLFSSTSSDQQPPSQTVAEIDSLEVADRPIITTQSKADTVDSIAPRAGEDLAPGTILLRGEVMQIMDKKNLDQKLVIEVQEVLAYGASASPIGAGQKLEIKVAKKDRENPTYKTLIGKGKTVAMIISEEADMSFGTNENQTSWTLIELKPNE